LVWSNPRVDCTFRKCSAGYYCPNATTETACSSEYYCPAGSASRTLYATLGPGCAIGWTARTVGSYPCIAAVVRVARRGSVQWSCPWTGYASDGTVIPSYFVADGATTVCGMQKITTYSCSSGTSVSYIVNPPICL
jgi:hypothetical protein